MSKTVWLITGAGRGMGTDIANAALAAGHAVVATGRDPERVAAATGARDVLVNNAGTFIAGFFKEISPGDFTHRSRRISSAR